MSRSSTTRPPCVLAPRNAGRSAERLAGAAVVARVSVRSHRAGRHCDGEVRLSAGPAPEIAPAIQSVAARWAQDATVDGRCVVVDVVAQDPAAVVCDREH